MFLPFVCLVCAKQFPANCFFPVVGVDSHNQADCILSWFDACATFVVYDTITFTSVTSMISCSTFTADAVVGRKLSGAAKATSGSRMN